MTSNRDFVPFGGAVLAPEISATEAVNRAIRETTRHDPLAVARYEDPSGSMVLRSQIARRMFWSARPIGAHDVLITKGCLDAVRLALSGVSKPGDTILLEHPTFFGFIQVARELGLRVVPIPVSPRTGLDLNQIESIVRRQKVRAAVVCPNYQNPVGYVMPDADKKALIEIAQRKGFFIIEADVYGELSHTPTRPKPLIAYDNGNTVIYCSSFSKTLIAGLRIGWIVGGPAHRAVQARLVSNGICVPGLNQAALASLLSDGGYDRHLNRLRVALRKQVQAIARHVRQCWPTEITPSDVTGGYLLWLECARDFDSMALFHAAEKNNISIVPGPVFTIDGSHQNCFRLNCGSPWSPFLQHGLETLAQLAKRQLPR